MISVFVYYCSMGEFGGAGLVGGASPPRASADSNAIAARLQGPFLGVSLDALSLEAAEATRRDACEKSGFESSTRPDAGTRGLLSLAVTRARPTAQ